MSDDGFVDDMGEEEDVDEEYTLAQELAALVSLLALRAHSSMCPPV